MSTPTLSQSSPQCGNNSANESLSYLDNAISRLTDKCKKPKRNRSAFILFSIDVRKNLKLKGLNNLNPNDRFVEIARLWKIATEEEKSIYEEIAQKEKDKYASDLGKFCKDFPSEPIQRPRNHIKKPCNAYGLYLKDMKEGIKRNNPKLRMCQVLQIVGERWRSLPANEKRIYERLAEEGRRNFKVEVTKQKSTTKKIKLGNRQGRVVTRQEEDQDYFESDQENLVCSDQIYQFDSGVDEYEENSDKFYASNNRTSMNQRSYPLNMDPTKAMNCENIGSGALKNMDFSLTLRETLNGDGLDFLSNAFKLPNDGSSQGMDFALRGLLNKVDKLKQHIELQLKVISKRAAREGTRRSTSFEDRGTKYDDSHHSEIISQASISKKEEL